MSAIRWIAAVGVRAAFLPRRGRDGLRARVLRRPRAAEDIAAVWGLTGRPLSGILDSI